MNPALIWISTICCTVEIVTLYNKVLPYINNRKILRQVIHHSNRFPELNFEDPLDYHVTIVKF